MKLVFCFLLLLALSVPSSAQVLVNNVNINEMPDVKFIQMISQERAKDALIAIDYGEQAVWNNDDKGVISGPDKKPVTFKSGMDALNFLYKNGWEFVDSKAVPAGAITRHYYILRRKEDK